MGSLMPAMAGVAERVVPCRVAAMPLARSRGGRGRVPPFPRPPRWLPTGKPSVGRHPISKLHPLCLHGKRPEVW